MHKTEDRKKTSEVDQSGLMSQTTTGTIGPGRDVNQAVKNISKKLKNKKRISVANSSTPVDGAIANVSDTISRIVGRK